MSINIFSICTENFVFLQIKKKKNHRNEKAHLAGHTGQRNTTVSGRIVNKHRSQGQISIPPEFQSRRKPNKKKLAVQDAPRRHTHVKKNRFSPNEFTKTPSRSLARRGNIVFSIVLVKIQNFRVVTKTGASTLFVRLQNGAVFAFLEIK